MDVRGHGRRAVSPIIATLLLIAIAVAAGIIVYVFVGGLSGSLTKGNNNQITEQLTLDAYNFPGSATATSSPGFLTLFVRNTGSSTLTVTSVYYDGILVTAPSAASCTPSTNICYFYKTCTNGCTNASPFSTATITAGGTAAIEFDSSGLSGASTPSLPSAGTSHLVKIVTADGGTFSLSVVAGSSG